MKQYSLFKAIHVKSYEICAKFCLQINLKRRRICVTNFSQKNACNLYKQIFPVIRNNISRWLFSQSSETLLFFTLDSFLSCKLE